MTNSIRPYQESDLNQLLTVWGKATRLAHPFLSEAFLAQEKLNIPSLYLPNAKTWVAINNDQVIGFIALIGNEVGAIFVDPAFHGQGFGKALMDTAQKLHAALEVDVFEANSIGRRFYQRYGFTHLAESVHQETGNNVLRLVFTHEFA